MANEIINFLKAHKGQIIKYGKKAFAWFKKRQSQQSQQSGQSQGQQSYGQQQQSYGQQQQQPYQQNNQQYSGYAGAAGHAGNGYNQQQSQNWNQPPPQNQYQNQNQNVQHGMNGVKPNHGKYDDNMVNQANTKYKQLRDQARSEGDQMAKCFDAAHQAHNQGDGARAKQMSNQGHQHQERMNQLNQEASDWIFKANNEDSGENEVDLHGLYTQEAIKRTEQAVRDAQAQGKTELRVIVGKGIHSKDHVAHIKPAIEKLMRDYNLAAHLDPHNSGVLVVNLQGQGGGSRDAGFTKDLAKQAGGDEEQVSSTLKNGRRIRDAGLSLVDFLLFL